MEDAADQSLRTNRLEKVGGYPPFADSEDQVAKAGAFEFHSPEWDNVSKVCYVRHEMTDPALTPEKKHDPDIDTLTMAHR